MPLLVFLGLLVSLERVGGYRLNHQAADLWVHNRIAWVGSHTCGVGVRGIDVAAEPREIAALADYENTTAEDVMVRRVHTAFFSGDLLVTGLQACRGGIIRGAEFWDVTDPSRPQRLARFDTNRGVHELYLFERDGRVLALLAVPGSEAGEARIVDASDPPNPRQLASWSIQQAPGGAPPPVGQLRSFLAHSIWADAAGTTAYVSYWDAGVAILDITDLESPRYLGRTQYAQGEEGNAHSAWPLEGRDLLLVTDEDFVCDGTWGYLRIYDTSNPAEPRQVGSFATPRSTQCPPPREGTFTVHNPFVTGDLVFLSWYHDGVHVLDVADAANPRELAFWEDPAAEIWGVYADGGTVYASDMQYGLHILRLSSSREKVRRPTAGLRAR